MTDPTPLKYVYVVERTDDGGYWAYLPDLPGCTTRGDTPEELRQRLPQAVQLYLSYYRDRGQPLPQPTAQTGTVSAA